MTAREELLGQGGVPKGAAVPLATHLRSTWVSAILRSVRSRGLMDRYTALVAPKHHAALLGNVVGTWLEMPVAMAHFEACEALDLPPSDLVLVGRESSAWLRSSMFGVLTNMAREVGATPFQVLTHMPRMWNRSVQGGALAVYKLGPKDARVEYLGFPLAQFSCVRHAHRGVMHGLCEPFARIVTVREVPKDPATNAIVYRISWA